MENNNIRLCEVLIDDTKYTGSYTKEDNILDINIQRYSYDFDNFGKINYKSIVLKDLDSGIYIYSPVFFNTGISLGMTSYTRFRTDFYFETKNVNQNISDLNPNIKVKEIKFIHPLLKNYFKNPGLEICNNDEYCQYRIKAKPDTKEIFINKNNVSKLVLGGESSWSDDWFHESIKIESQNYIKLCLNKEIGYEEILSYIQEMNVYLNTYFPIGLKACATYVVTNNGNCLNLIHKNLGIKNYKHTTDVFIKDSFFDFIQKMYVNVDYRISTNKNNFLPLEFNIPTSLEDKFLFYFRYIDMYVGKKLSQSGKLPNNFTRLEYFVDNNKDLFDSTDLSNVNFKSEINSLRNHYIHEGYYLHNNEFNVNDKSRNFLYSKNLDYKWLLRITNSLKCGVYRMLYKEILSFDINEQKLFELLKHYN